MCTQIVKRLLAVVSDENTVPSCFQKFAEGLRKTRIVVRNQNAATRLNHLDHLQEPAPVERLVKRKPGAVRSGQVQKVLNSVPRHDDHLDVRLAGVDLQEALDAAFPGQFNVHENDVEVLFPGPLYRLLSGEHPFDPVSVQFQHVDHALGEVPIVIDN